MIKKFLRTVQTYFPAVLELKFTWQRLFRRIVKRPFEYDFYFLDKLPGAQSMLIFDVGANRGQSIDAIRLFAREAEIVAFEPDGILFKRLSSRFISDKRLKVFNFGLGEKEGGFTLYTPVYNGWPFDGLASFDKSAARSWINSDTVFGYDEKKLVIEEQACQIRTIDSLNLSPSFIKIDVQGLEDSVLKGGAHTLEKCKPYLLIETGDEIFKSEILDRLGYIPGSYENGAIKIGVCGKQNTIFIHESRVAELISFSVDCR